MAKDHRPAEPERSTPVPVGQFALLFSLVAHGCLVIMGFALELLSAVIHAGNTSYSGGFMAAILAATWGTLAIFERGAFGVHVRSLSDSGEEGPLTAPLRRKARLLILSLTVFPSLSLVLLLMFLIGRETGFRQAPVMLIAICIQYVMCAMSVFYVVGRRFRQGRIVVVSLPTSTDA